MVSNNDALGRYALFAAVIASSSLPLYVHLPAYLAGTYGISLDALGGLLLALRLVDFVQDPTLGWLVGRLGPRRDIAVAVAGAILAAGMIGLFAVAAPIAPLLWVAGCLVLAFTGFSMLSILVYSDGVARGAKAGHIRVATWREAGTLTGVTIACVLPFALGGDGYRGFAVTVAIGLLVAVTAMRGRWMAFSFDMPPLKELFADLRLRRFLILAFVNALPVAVSTTLFVFFVELRLDLPGQAGLFLVLFFVAAAISTPVWRAVANAIGPRRALATGMILAIASFSWAYSLEAGDQIWFAIVCITSGAAFGADMILLPALFSQFQARASKNPALAFGFWNFASKASLALAAGIMLPVLTWMGFSATGPIEPEALDALAFCYAVIPCILKLAALWMILRVIAPEDTAGVPAHK